MRILNMVATNRNLTYQRRRLILPQRSLADGTQLQRHCNKYGCRRVDRKAYTCYLLWLSLPAADLASGLQIAWLTRLRVVNLLPASFITQHVGCTLRMLSRLDECDESTGRHPGYLAASG